MNRDAALFALVSALVASSVGCTPSPEKIEGQRVLHEIDVLRDSNGPGSVRLDLVKQLEADATTVPLAAIARDACTKAYRPLMEATVTMDEMKRAKEEGSIGPDVFSALKEAEAAIDASKASMPACEKAHDELARAVR